MVIMTSFRLCANCVSAQFDHAFWEILGLLFTLCYTVILSQASLASTPDTNKYQTGNKVAQKRRGKRGDYSRSGVVTRAGKQRQNSLPL